MAYYSLKNKRVDSSLSQDLCFIVVDCAAWLKDLKHEIPTSLRKNVVIHDR